MDLLYWRFVGGTFLLTRKNTDDSISRCNLGIHIKVRVNVHGGGNIAMPQPHLNFFHADTISVEQAGTTMSKIMEANLFHIVLFEKQIEVLGDKVGLDKSAHGIYIICSPDNLGSSSFHKPFD